MNFFKPFEMPTGAAIPEREVSIVDFGAVPCQLTESGEVVHGSHKNTEAIKADTEALEKAFYALSEKLYKQSGAQGAGPDMGADQGAQGNQGFYNADFEDKSN